MSDIGSAEWFARKLGDRSILGIGLETGALIRTGKLPVGTKLPPVRDLAFALGISPATISEAWRELRRQKIITGRGRNGTFVSGDSFVARPERLASSGNYGPGSLNLLQAVPDRALLPPLREALAYGASAQDLNSYDRSRILPELEAVVRRTWPYDPGAFLATNGGYNAVYTLLHALVAPGSVIAIEDPTAMRLLDIVENLGLHIVPVDGDAAGPDPASLQEALKRRPAAFLYQPRLHSVTGATVCVERMAALGEVLTGSDCLIVEDDGMGDISARPPATLGNRFPDRVIHVHSYSKTLGPDLRIAVLSSSATIVENIQSYRSFSAGWTSRALQAATAWLLRDAATGACVARARDIYRDRQAAIVDRLAGHGVTLAAAAGLCIWLPVVSESYALVTLASRRIAVHPGSKFSVRTVDRIRVATSIIDRGYDEIADALALAARRAP